MYKVLLHTTSLFVFPFLSCSQFEEGTPQYRQQDWISRQSLNETVQSHPDVVDKYFPHKEAFDLYSRYRESIPHSEDFVIGILVNPCGVNRTDSGSGRTKALGYDCCMERFGEGEYGYLKYEEELLQYEFSPLSKRQQTHGSRVIAGPDEVLHNMILVDEYGREIPPEHSRRADDHIVIDESCTEFRTPNSACIGNRLRAIPNPLKAACTDNNQTVDSTLDCFSPSGERLTECMQVSYSQNAVIHICGGEFADDDHCGTFLEIHRHNGSPYDEEETILAETKITTQETNGMTTTTIPLSYKKNPSRLLCAFQDEKIRVGSTVRINELSAKCCCPPAYSYAKKIGSFFCPRKRGTRDGPFADSFETLDEMFDRDKDLAIYPFCHAMLEAEDRLMCSKQATEWSTDHSLTRFYTYPCSPVSYDGVGMFSSDILNGNYMGQCPLGDTFRACALIQGRNKCSGSDSHFSFVGELGKVVRLPEDDDGHYGVSFNDGRTSYNFTRHEIELQIPESNYEMWFVQRNRFEKIVQKKKPFRVIWPPCTFDPVNDQYFPFAQKINGDLLKILRNYDDAAIPDEN